MKFYAPSIDILDKIKDFPIIENYDEKKAYHLKNQSSLNILVSHISIGQFSIMFRLRLIRER